MYVVLEGAALKMHLSSVWGCVCVCVAMEHSQCAHSKQLLWANKTAITTTSSTSRNRTAMATIYLMTLYGFIVIYRKVVHDTILWLSLVWPAGKIVCRWFQFLVFSFQHLVFCFIFSGNYFNSIIFVLCVPAVDVVFSCCLFFQVFKLRFAAEFLPLGLQIGRGVRKE